MIEAKHRVGALDIAELISARLGSYVDATFIEFLAVDGDAIRCWYMNSGGKGPTFDITLTRGVEGWSVELSELPAGTEQEIELP